MKARVSIKLAELVDELASESDTKQSATLFVKVGGVIMRPDSFMIREEDGGVLLSFYGEQLYPKGE